MPVSALQMISRLDLIGGSMVRNVSSPRELEIVLRAPVGPQRLHDDTIVIDEDGWYRLITPSSSWPAANEIFFSNLSGTATDHEIDAIIAEYHQRGLTLTWCVYPWTEPADLGDRLLARGASASKITAFLGHTSVQLNSFPGVEVELIDQSVPQSFENYMSVISRGYQLPPDEEAFRRQRYFELMTWQVPYMRLFLARFQGAVAGVCAVIVKNDSAHMSGVYVVPEFQARGVFPSIKAVGLAFLRDQGIELVTGHANSQSAFWVERFGSKPVYSYTIYELSPPDRR